MQAETPLHAEINQLLDWKPNGRLAEMPTVSPEAHRYGMRHFAAGVCLITSAHDGQKAGLTATAVCSVTANPPRLVVFVNKNVAASPVILDSGSLCVNVLASDQEDIAKVFAGMVQGVHGEERFEHGQWSELISGAPVLDGALAGFDCRVIKVFDESTHHAFLCEVLGTRERADGAALIYLNGAFRSLPQ